MTRMKLGVLISGRGSNLAALIAACAEPNFPAEIVLVVSNKAEAGGLDHARKAGIATLVIDHRAQAGREAFDAAIDAALRAAGVELVCLAGFMRLLSETFIAGRAGRILNIHPSLLPSFRGLDAQAQALTAGVRIAGCTVHVVVPEMDAGPIVAQAAVPVLPGDTEDALSARILAAEHRLYPAAVRLFAEGRALVTGGTVSVDAAAPADAALLNPPPG
ncbi:MAG: phosphoribosylglycinamide formyltransferase [Alphaproteobacteria bacterium]|nr:phosphoribosylglycinamide formyltransferase [Alphaproteobacteria bacterium]